MVADKQNRYLIVPESLYYLAIKAANDGERFFELIDGKPYFLGAEIIIRKSWADYGC
jgi:hypothetical protein